MFSFQERLGFPQSFHREHSPWFQLDFPNTFQNWERTNSCCSKPQFFKLKKEPLILFFYSIHFWFHGFKASPKSLWGYWLDFSCSLFPELSFVPMAPALLFNIFGLFPSAFPCVWSSLALHLYLRMKDHIYSSWHVVSLQQASPLSQRRSWVGASCGGLALFTSRLCFGAHK